MYVKALPGFFLDAIPEKFFISLSTAFPEEFPNVLPKIISQTLSKTFLVCYSHVPGSRF